MDKGHQQQKDNLKSLFSTIWQGRITGFGDRHFIKEINDYSAGYSKLAAAMKTLLAFLVLLSHMNFTMFIPQVNEADVRNTRGIAEDDINSLFEYLDEVVFGNVDDTPEDEDDDQEQSFRIAVLDQCPSSRDFVLVKSPALQTLTLNYPLYLHSPLPATVFDVPSPPPEV